MGDNRSKIKQKLDKELTHVSFSTPEAVIEKAGKLTLKQKLALVWNKEIELPLLPVGAIIAVVFFYAGMRTPTIDSVNKGEEQQIVEVHGNMYWKSDIERLTAYYDD